MESLKEQLESLNGGVYGNGLDLQWFEIRYTRHEPSIDNPRYAVWAIGQWKGHIMNWRGCNFWHKLLSKGVPLKSVEEARQWIVDRVEDGSLHSGMTINSGSFMSSDSDDREVATVHFSELSR